MPEYMVEFADRSIDFVEAATADEAVALATREAIDEAGSPESIRQFPDHYRAVRAVAAEKVKVKSIGVFGLAPPVLIEEQP